MDDLERELCSYIQSENTADEKETRTSMEFCSFCNSDLKVVHDPKNGNIVCISCGTILTEYFDDRPEWRHYDEENHDLGRCGLPISALLPQSSLGTNIGGTFKSRIRTLHNWSAMPYKERSLNHVLKKIQYYCNFGGIVRKVEYDAQFLYKHVVDGIIRGINRECVIAAAIFFACRRNNQTRSPKEIAKIMNLTETEVTNGCKTFTRLAKEKNFSLDLGNSSPEHFVKRFCEELFFEQKVTKHAVDVVKNVILLGIGNNHTPTSLAIGCILVICEVYDISLTKKAISNKFNVSDVTITKTYNNLIKFKTIIIDNQLTKTTHDILYKK